MARSRSPRSTSRRTFLRGRLLGLARGWGRGTGPRALLACPPGERHDLGLIAFGLALRERGWRIDFLGGDTPAESIAGAARAIEPRARGRERGHGGSAHGTRDAPGTARAALQSCGGGAGAHGFVAPGVLALTGDPVAEADRLSAIVAS